MVRPLARFAVDVMTPRACILPCILMCLINCAAPPAQPPLSNPDVAELSTVFDARCFAKTAPQEVTTIVTQQVMVRPATTSPDGSITFPPVFRNEDLPVTEVIDNGVEFETLCDAELTEQRIATLQRALKARLVYEGLITGVYDAATQAAVQSVQVPRGINSPKLSRSLAEELGVVPISTPP